MSIQDDYFDLTDYFKGRRGRVDKEMAKAFERIWQWGCDLEKDTDTLRFIVREILDAIEDIPVDVRRQYAMEKMDKMRKAKGDTNGPEQTG